MSLYLSLFPWAAFRRTNGGIKLHTLLDHDGYCPFVALSPAREHEIKKARSLSLPKGSIVVEDLGYTDYAWYTQLTAQKIFFVTRQKRNARYAVLEHRQVKKNQGGGIFTKSLNLGLSVFISVTVHSFLDTDHT